MITLATVPLEKLPLASIDLETTGLSPASDRIVQIAMTDPWDETNNLDLLVNPGITIPPKSTAIHGIDNTTIAEADAITDILPRFRAKLSTRVLLGYNIGFDLAVLAAEADRHGLEWDWQAALCVRQLAVNASGANAGATLFGGLRTEAGRFDIKRYLLLLLVETLRVLAISRGIGERNSARRADALRRASIAAEIPLLAEDIHFALKLVLRQQINDIAIGLPPGSTVEVDGLSAAERKLLKSIRGRVSRIETVLQDCLFG